MKPYNEGIIDILQNKLEDGIKDAKREYTQAKKNSKNYQKGGMDPGTLGVIAAVIKIGLMTFGTYILNWWPGVFLVSLMCVYIEYKMTKIGGQNIVGLPLVYIFSACACPCCWTIFRIFKGWTNTVNVTTGGLYKLLSNCSTLYSILDIYNIDGKVCSDGDGCYMTNKECHKVIFPTGTK